jgi:hypothetical protein
VASGVLDVNIAQSPYTKTGPKWAFLCIEHRQAVQFREHRRLDYRKALARAIGQIPRG